jgi:beta-galactosidase
VSVEPVGGARWRLAGQGGEIWAEPGVVPPVLGVQYYRPPFPERRHWVSDLPAIREAGLDAVQLWAVWGWIEAEPGRFRWDDYDRLIELADREGLRVVISTVAEVQPFWVPRLFPDALMVDHRGRPVVSSPRVECNVGLTPGGCIDHPGLRERLGAFLTAIGQRYADSAALLAWDCWNELRWAVGSEGHVCHCPRTVATFRRWLEDRYGDLEGLSRAWRRRYASWEDVWPGRLPGRPYTDLVEFQAFLTWRASAHMADRYRWLREGDPRHPILAHCASPSTWSDGSDRFEPHPGYEQALSRGNDWRHADVLDGYGGSHFPHWMRMTAAELGSRLESVRSAAGARPVWVSELQGGPAWTGDDPGPPLSGALQQSWVWRAIARGARGILFWSWRDETFGWESGSFGLVGHDGHAADRLQALRRTRELIDAHGPLLASYRPDPPRIGVLFEERSYHLDWADRGRDAAMAGRSLQGYLLALERLQLPYEVVDSDHLGALDRLALLVLPWPKVVRPAAAGAVAEWVEGGGTLLVEAELDAFDEHGFFRHPGDRPLARRLGVHSRGRRPIGARPIRLDLGGRQVSILPHGLVEAYDAGGAEILGRTASGEAVATRRQIRRGQVICLGTYPGAAYRSLRDRGLEALLEAMVGLAGAGTEVHLACADGDLLQWRLGHSGPDRVLFVANLGPRLRTAVRLSEAVLQGTNRLEELVGGVVHPVPGGETSVELDLPELGLAILRWRPRAGSRAGGAPERPR